MFSSLQPKRTTVLLTYPRNLRKLLFPLLHRELTHLDRIHGYQDRHQPTNPRKRISHHSRFTSTVAQPKVIKIPPTQTLSGFPMMLFWLVILIDPRFRQAAKSRGLKRQSTTQFCARDERLLTKILRPHMRFPR